MGAQPELVGVDDFGVDPRDDVEYRDGAAVEVPCAFSIFVFTDFIGLFRPALFLHPRMIHPLDP